MSLEGITSVVFGMIGGGALVAFMARVVFKQILARNLQAYKSELSRTLAAYKAELSQDLERLRAQLKQRHTIFDQRFELVREVYERCAKMQQVFQEGSSDQRPWDKGVVEAIESYLECAERGAILLEREVTAKMDLMHSELRGIVSHFQALRFPRFPTRFGTVTKPELQEDAKIQQELDEVEERERPRCVDRCLEGINICHRIEDVLRQSLQG